MNSIKENRFSWRKRLLSFTYAFSGLKKFFSAEHNAWIHLAATFFVLIISIILPVSRMEIIALVFAVGLVWMAELINTAIEKIMDFISVEKREEIRWIKDLSAAAVLIAAMAALAAGCIVFIPKIL